MREEEGREPGKGKVFAVYANSNSKEEWIHPSSNQVSTPLFEGRTINADMCMNPGLIHGSLAVCQAGTACQGSLLT